MNSEYKDCQCYFEGRCRCMDSSFNQDFYECPQCEDVSYCYYKQLKRCEQKLKKIKKGLRTCSIGCKKCGIQDFCQTYKIRKIIEGTEE